MTIDLYKVTKFIRIPLLDERREAQEDCDSRRGHTLIIRDRSIVCIDCDAEWKDMGV